LVTVDGREISRIGRGLVVLLGVFDDDTESDATFLAEKTTSLRIFDDAAGNMNLSLIDVGGEALCISQFTLCANARKGRRPSFSKAMPPHEAERLYELFCEQLAMLGVPVFKGVFGAEMSVEIVNDGPVTIILNSRETRRQNHRDKSPSPEKR